MTNQQQQPSDSIPDSFDPAALQQLLELRQKGPTSEALPVIDFSVANHPSDLTFVIAQILKKSDGGVSMIALLAAASSLLGYAISSVVLSISKESDPIAVEPLRALLEAVITADLSIQRPLRPTIDRWLQDVDPDAMRKAKEDEDFTALQRALISDKVLEVLQITRADLDMAASGPGVDS